MRRKKPYDERYARRLDAFFRSRIRSRGISNTAGHIYLLGLPRLEREQGGCCRPVTASSRDVAEAACIGLNSVKKARDELVRFGLIEVVVGQAVVSDRCATQVRRRTIEELISGAYSAQLEDHHPPLAAELVRRLSCRKFAYGTDLVTPNVHMAATGRIYHSNPPIQNGSGEARYAKLAENSGQDHVLAYADFQQAELTVLKHLLHREGLLDQYSWPRDPYQTLASIMGQPMDGIKSVLNAAIGRESTRAFMKPLALKPESFFPKLAEAVDRFKEHLWIAGKPRGKVKRHVHTLKGTLIQAPQRNRKLHRGIPLKWLLEATIAEIVNPVCLEVLNLEAERSWKFLLPVHDGIYVITGVGEKWELPEMMERHAREYGIALKADLKPFSPHIPGSPRGGKGGPNLGREQGQFSVPNLGRKKSEVVASAQD